MDRKKLPIGISDYKKIISEDYYYVDKTDFIRQVIDEGSAITLLPRPRRFGKTLNLSMLRYFFERTEGNVYRPLFAGKQIEQWKEYDKYQGKYPVIFITLKDCKGETFEDALYKVGNELTKEFERHDYLLQDLDMKPASKTVFDSIYKGCATQSQMENALRLLSDLLTRHWGMSPLVLLDEYDTPIHTAFDKGYYDRMIGFMRNFMSAVFKDNTDLFRGVITGILRISKESIFSGLNNIAVFSLLDRPLCTSFGFSQEEIDRMLDDYSLGDTRVAVKEWYNGYLFAGEEVYNPWSALNYILYNGVFSPYWVNTGSDVLLRYLLANGPTQIRQGVEGLIQGESICSIINDKLAFPDLLSNPANIWSFMLFSGYLKASNPRPVGDLREYTLTVPNREVRSVYSSIIQSWISAGPVKSNRLELLLQALYENNMAIFQRVLREFVLDTLSYYDTGGREPEKVYQAFLLGLLSSSSAYEVSSNRESGLGRYDILMRPRDIRKRGIIMELKVCDLDYGETVESTLASALQQIEDKHYEATLRAAGVDDILKMAITFDGKQVWVKSPEK